jgi:hypothetical protein
MQHRFTDDLTDMQLQHLLNKSHATREFKDAILSFTGGADSPLIVYSERSPRIKVLRVLMKLLEAFPGAAIDSVHIEGESRCSSYRGHLMFGPDNQTIEFSWDCAWKAEQEGYMTWYGAPDQTKAAQEFGYQCFHRFARVQDSQQSSVSS